MEVTVRKHQTLKVLLRGQIFLQIRFKFTRAPANVTF